MPLKIQTTLPVRDTAKAMKYGLLGKCPSCGKSRLFKSFLKNEERCENCGEVFAHHRADDFPPYIVMFIIGHIIGYGILETEMNYEWPIWLQFAIWLPATLILGFGLIQPVKGAVIGLQWALRMHGFAEKPADAEKISQV